MIRWLAFVIGASLAVALGAGLVVLIVVGIHFLMGLFGPWAQPVVAVLFIGLVFGTILWWIHR